MKTIKIGKKVTGKDAFQKAVDEKCLNDFQENESAVVYLEYDAENSPGLIHFKGSITCHYCDKQNCFSLEHRKGYGTRKEIPCLNCGCSQNLDTSGITSKKLDENGKECFDFNNQIAILIYSIPFTGQPLHAPKLDITEIECKE
jgi:hypothetical protein